MNKFIVFVFSIILVQFSFAESEFSADLLNIIQNKCVSCHDNTVNGDFRNLKTDTQWVKAGYILPGDPANSLLIKKLSNYGGDMPPAGETQLTTAEFQLLFEAAGYLDPANYVGEFKQPAARDLNIEINVDINSIETQLQIFQKCYQQFTNLPVTLNGTAGSYITRIKSKQVTAVDACMEIFDLASMEDSDEPNSSPLSRRVLQTFNNFHLSWFPIKDNPSAFSQLMYHMERFFDLDSPALYLTKNLFTSQQYREIVEGEKSYKAIRKTNNVRTYVQDPVPPNDIVNRIITAPFFYATEILASGPLNSTRSVGELYGIEESSDSHMLTNIDIQNSVQGSNGSTSNITRNLFKHYGGGILGDTNFMLLNDGDYLADKMDGGMKAPRTLAKNILGDLLCRQIPMLRTFDETPFVDATKSSRLPFRNSNACMKCHATMDPMSAVYRNFHYARTSAGTTPFISALITAPLGISFIHKQVVDSALDSIDYSTWPDDGDDDYFKTIPHGKLYYRSYTGELVNKNIVGIKKNGGLGGALAETNDLYACAAKRYLHFFTGIKVDLVDLGDISAPKLSEKELDYRQYVHELGQQLKTDQDLRNLVKSIISSKAYIKPGLGVK